MFVAGEAVCAWENPQSSHACSCETTFEPPEPIILKLKRAAEDALAAASNRRNFWNRYAAASQYFQHFNGMAAVEDDDLLWPRKCARQKRQTSLHSTSNFTNRNRRPPTDPVNAMLSLAYSMLAKDCTFAALAVGFDPYIGFLSPATFWATSLGTDFDGRNEAIGRGIHSVKLHQQSCRYGKGFCPRRSSGQSHRARAQTLFPNV